MGTVTGTAYSGVIKIALSDVEDDLVDLQPGAMRGLRAEQPEMDCVIAELSRSVPIFGDKAGISSKVYQHFLTSRASSRSCCATIGPSWRRPSKS